MDQQKEITVLTPIVLKFGEKVASVQNPTLNYLEFVFTDNKPNANNVGIPEAAFASIIDTGILMPVKMADGEISRGHEGTTPIGVISAMDKRQVEDYEQVVGKAALWSKEHPDSINLLKEAYAAGDPLNMSWEVIYTDSTLDDNGTEWIKDPIVRAITVVGAPAYKGRTPIERVASDATDSEDLNVEELETLKAQLAELETKKTELETQLAAKVAELEAASTELAALKEFKAEADRQAAEKQLLETRLATLGENGIKYSEEDVAAKKEMLLKLDETAFNYLVAELKEAIKEEHSEETDKTKIPGPVTKVGTKSPMEVVRDGFQNLKLR